MYGSEELISLLTMAACFSLDKKSLRALPAGSSFRCDSIPDFGNAIAGGVLDGCVDQKIPRSLGRIACEVGVPALAFVFDNALVVVAVVVVVVVLSPKRCTFGMQKTDMVILLRNGVLITPYFQKFH